MAVEVLAAAQAYDLRRDSLGRAAKSDAVYQLVRGAVPHYRDDRPLGDDIDIARRLVRRPLRVLN